MTRMIHITHITWFLVDNKGERWMPLRGEYEGIGQAREEQARLNAKHTLLAPFKLYKRKVEVMEE